jgi:uncharacterized protein YeaO (DUF488 family)
MPPLLLSEYFWTAPRRPGEGLRVSCTRFLPRGVKKADYASEGYLDVWLPVLSPSRELLRWVRANERDDDRRWSGFVRRYRAEMAKTDPRQTIQMLAMLALHTPISLGCACQWPRCHRFELVKLIRSAAAATF